MAHEARFSYDTLHAFAGEVLAAAGAPPGHCAAVADHLIDSNLAGHDSHGAHRLLQYTDAIQQGGIDPKATPQTVRDTATTAVLEATAVFGQVAGLAATELAIAKARAHGTAVVGVRNANHVGRAGVYALRMAAAGLVGQVFCSGRGAGIVAPWGGTTPILSTNPIAVAVPTAGDPVVLDCTTSVTAEGKVRVARFAGKELPPGQILDREGRPSIRPDDFYDGGSMLPLGADMGHKGYGMSVIVDLVGAMLAGGHAGAARDRQRRILQQVHPVGRRPRGPGRPRRHGGAAAGVLRAAEVVGSGSPASRRSCCPASRSCAAPRCGGARGCPWTRARCRSSTSSPPASACTPSLPGHWGRKRGLQIYPGTRRRTASSVAPGC